MACDPVTRFTVSLSKHRPHCLFCPAVGLPRTRLTSRGGVGYTTYVFRCSPQCRTRLYGAAVAAGAPFAPGEYTNDRRAS